MKTTSLIAILFFSLSASAQEESILQLSEKNGLALVPQTPLILEVMHNYLYTMEHEIYWQDGKRLKPGTVADSKKSFCVLMLDYISSTDEPSLVERTITTEKMLVSKAVGRLSSDGAFTTDLVFQVNTSRGMRDPFNFKCTTPASLPKEVTPSDVTIITGNTFQVIALQAGSLNEYARIIAEMFVENEEGIKAFKAAHHRTPSIESITVESIAPDTVVSDHPIYSITRYVIRSENYWSDDVVDGEITWTVTKTVYFDPYEVVFTNHIKKE